MAIVCHFLNMVPSMYYNTNFQINMIISEDNNGPTLMSYLQDHSIPVNNIRNNYI